MYWKLATVFLVVLLITYATVLIFLSTVSEMDQPPEVFAEKVGTIVSIDPENKTIVLQRQSSFVPEEISQIQISYDETTNVEKIAFLIENSTVLGIRESIPSDIEAIAPGEFALVQFLLVSDPPFMATLIRHSEEPLPF